MSDRMEKTREQLGALRGDLMEWFAPEDGDVYPADKVDAALAEVEEWETRLHDRRADVKRLDHTVEQILARAEAAEAENAKMKELLYEDNGLNGVVPQLHRAEAERDRLREALKEIQWGGYTFIGTEPCPSCSNERIDGHASDCIVRAALGEQT